MSSWTSGFFCSLSPNFPLSTPLWPGKPPGLYHCPALGVGYWMTLPRKCPRHTCGHHSRITDAQPDWESQGCHYDY
jgi:hypothetical protein